MVSRKRITSFNPWRQNPLFANYVKVAAPSTLFDEQPSSDGVECRSRGLLTSGLRAWYSSDLKSFLDSEDETILGHLSGNSQYAVSTSQIEAWKGQIALLKSELTGYSGALLMEFTVPRIGSRIDVVLLINAVVFAIEFKVGEEQFTRSAIEQVWDYALDLKNFHRESHAVSVVPLLVSTGAPAAVPSGLNVHEDRVYAPITINPDQLRGTLDRVLAASINEKPISIEGWATSPYQPTPTIIEAAKALYSRHSVDAITRNDAGAKNLALTSNRIDQIVDFAKANSRKVICFVTGVPGAGKTLVGLNVATRHRDEDAPTHAVFLSGNGPLVAVLREALARDEISRRTIKAEKAKKSEIRKSIEAFIQNIHHFRDAGLVDRGPPCDHVVIFDEAQRAWNLKQTSHFMRRKKGQPGFNQSESDFLISYMDRHQDWAVIVCLVGGGQEINTGEAGISSWLEAVRDTYPRWDVHISNQLADREYAAAETLDTIIERPNVYIDEALHLSVSMRSFRAEHLSSFVKALLDCDVGRARTHFGQIQPSFPMVVTRSIDVAKKWIRQRARGSERYGLVASSKAQRLKPHAIDIRVDVDPIHWFLNGRDDTRSSYYLEDAATEFQVQGLELDWVCVTWDGDLRFNGQAWTFHDFRGSRWTNIHQIENQNYLRNAYRVLLTRARQGMVVFVPRGSDSDPTRSAEFYDATFQYLRDLGIPELL